MNTITLKTLERLDATYGQRSHTPTKKRLKVFYGWSKINKIQKREAIAIAFENSEGAGWENSRSGKSIRKTMTICYERYQRKALADNAEKDRKHVSPEELKKISQSLETAFIATHTGYKEPSLELDIPFT